MLADANPIKGRINSDSALIRHAEFYNLPLQTDWPIHTFSPASGEANKPLNTASDKLPHLSPAPRVAVLGLPQSRFSWRGYEDGGRAQPCFHHRPHRRDAGAKVVGVIASGTAGWPLREGQRKDRHRLTPYVGLVRLSLTPAALFDDRSRANYVIQGTQTTSGKRMPCRWPGGAQKS